jgi:threonine/homoserine/homoserine lactone efflux protein
LAGIDASVYSRPDIQERGAAQVSWLDLAPSNLLSFVLTCLVIELTPGPNMGYLAVLGATAGRRAGLAAVAGVAMGLLIVGVGAALGLAAVIESSPALYQSLRWAGVLYFLWLAWDGWRAAGQPQPDLMQVQHTDARYFGRGLMTNLLNPKAMVFYVAVLPSFVDPAAAIAVQTLILSVLFVAIATLLHASIVMLSSTIQRFLQDDVRRRIVARGLSLTLVGIAVWFAASTEWPPV